MVVFGGGGVEWGRGCFAARCTGEPRENLGIGSDVLEGEAEAGAAGEQGPQLLQGRSLLPRRQS